MRQASVTGPSETSTSDSANILFVDSVNIDDDDDDDDYADDADDDEW